MPLSRRQFNLLLGSVSAASLLPWTAASAQQTGGTLVSSASEPAVLTSIDRNGPESISNKVFDGLVDHDADLNPVPALATSWEISADALRHTFHLRDGVTWHDGQPFSSADVKFSIELLKELHPRRRATFANLVDVETPDELTAVLVFSSPAPYLYGALNVNGAPIVPRHIYEGTEIATNPAQSAPIGTGPYVFKEWARGSHVLLERNSNYWDEGKPYLDRVVLRFIPDATAKVAALEAGDLDLDRLTLPLGERDRLKTVPHLVVADLLKHLGGTHHQFFFNLDTPVLQDIRVRQAIAHALNIDEVIKTIYLGYARPAPSIIGPNLPEFHNPAIKPHAFDLELANRLLDEAGHPRGADGTRFSLRILYNSWTDITGKLAEYLRSAFIPLGIRGEVENYDYATYVTRVYTDRAFDIDVETLANGYDPTDGVQRGYWSKAFKPGVPWSNAAHYTNERVDALFEEAAREPDAEKRKALYFEAQELVYADLPSIGLVSPDDFAVYNRKFENVLGNQSVNLADARLAGV